MPIRRLDGDGPRMEKYQTKPILLGTLVRPGGRMNCDQQSQFSCWTVGRGVGPLMMGGLFGGDSLVDFKRPLNLSSGMAAHARLASVADETGNAGLVPYRGWQCAWLDTVRDSSKRG